VLKGVNWYGFETIQGVVHGLYAQPVSFFIDLLDENGFNAVRIPLDLDLVLHDRKHGYIKPEPTNPLAADSCFEELLAKEMDIITEEQNSPDIISLDDAMQRTALRSIGVCGGPSPLMKKTSLEVLDFLIDSFAAKGILVLLDLHCLSTQGTDKSPVFFDASHPVASTIKGWQKLAKRLGSRWNVIGADVFNEPFGATWAEGKATDVDVFAQKVATAVQADAPGWLIFVEGTAKSPSCASVIDGDSVSCGYGDNLLGAMAAPLELGVKEKLVYSFHTYGPSQHDRPEFHNAAFPANMPDVWEAHWGKLVDKREEATPAMVLGEWGGPVGDGSPNAKWADALVEYLQLRNLTSNFFWALNMDGTPKGLITDWTANPPTIDKAKIALLTRLTPQPTEIMPPRSLIDF